MSKPPVIGLALGAGGARGWCHIGVLRGLEELGVKPDLIAGCSMGALVGVAWADGKLDQLEEWVRALTPARVVRLLDISLRSGGLVEARGIEDLLADLGIAREIEDLERKFSAVATDMETGREIWLRDGPTYPAVRSSASIPGVMSPKRYRDMWLLAGWRVDQSGAGIDSASHGGGHHHCRQPERQTLRAYLEKAESQIDSYRLGCLHVAQGITGNIRDYPGVARRNGHAELFFCPDCSY